MIDIAWAMKARAEGEKARLDLIRICDAQTIWKPVYRYSYDRALWMERKKGWRGTYGPWLRSA